MILLDGDYVRPSATTWSMSPLQRHLREKATIGNFILPSLCKELRATALHPHELWWYRRKETRLMVFPTYARLDAYATLSTMTPNIRHLCLSGNKFINEQHIKIIVSVLPFLALVDVSWCDNLSDVSFAHFQMCHSLVSINASGRAQDGDYEYVERTSDVFRHLARVVSLERLTVKWYFAKKDQDSLLQTMMTQLTRLKTLILVPVNGYPIDITNVTRPKE